MADDRNETASSEMEMRGFGHFGYGGIRLFSFDFAVNKWSRVFYTPFLFFARPLEGQRLLALIF